MRVFIAVPCPSELAAALDAMAGRLPASRWRVVPREARHVTLRFLGEQPPPVVAAAGTAMTAASRRSCAFAVTVRGAGAFPNARRPDVVWVGCGEGAERLADLVAALESELAAAGLPSEPRPFRPHLTLARRRPAAPVDSAAADVAALVARHAHSVVGDLAVDGVTLFQSELGPRGARYTALQTCPLRRLAPM